MKNTIKMLAATGLVAASLSVSQAQPYYVTGAGLTPSWSPGAAANQMTGGPTVYSLTTATMTNAIYEFKITGATWGDPNWPANNAKIKGDPNGMNTFYFYPGVISDGWTPNANRIGYDDPGNMTWGIAGDFDSATNNFDGTKNILVSIGNGVFSNNIVVTSAGSHQYKFQSPPGSWSDVYFGATLENGGANGSFTTTNSPQTVPVVLDLSHGRWHIGTLAPPPVTNEVVFAVDMTVEALAGRFNPASDKVLVSGSFNSWPGTGGSAVVLTNYPTWGGNTNIYYGTNTIISAPLTGYEYKFTDTDPALSSVGGYEPLSTNRKFSLLSSNGVVVLPVVLFGNSYLSDYLTADTMVTFTINMTNAMTSTNSPSAHNSPPGYTAHPFDPVNDILVINGNFLSGGWVNSWKPLDLNGNALVNNPLGSGIWQFTYTVPKGNPVEVHYKYGIIYGSNPATNSIVDNEAATSSDHIRNIRSTVTGSYAMPMDTFGDQHVEPSFGQLAVGPASAGDVALSWLGRPGVHVQTTTNLTSPSWMDHFETDGTNWSAGVMSTNGLVSSTNWPAGGGCGFFRLIKQ